jgi:hypothetical protein
MQQRTSGFDRINQTNDLTNEGICHIRVTGSPGACPSRRFACGLLNQTFDIIVPPVGKLILQDMDGVATRPV